MTQMTDSQRNILRSVVSKSVKLKHFSEEERRDINFLVSEGLLVIEEKQTPTIEGGIGNPTLIESITMKYVTITREGRKVLNP